MCYVVVLYSSVCLYFVYLWLATTHNDIMFGMLFWCDEGHIHSKPLNIPLQMRLWGYIGFTLSVRLSVCLNYFLSIVMELYGMLYNILSGIYVWTKIVEMKTVELGHFSAKLGLMCCPQVLLNYLQDCNETWCSVR